MELNINITVGVTPTLGQLLHSLASACPTTELTPEPVTEVPQVSITPCTETQAEQPKAEPQAEPQAEPEAAPAETAPQPNPEMVADYSDDYVRAAIDRARTRIIGEDWETDKTTERYAKYYKALNKELKRIAIQLGQSIEVSVTKPTELPANGIREAFVRTADSLCLDENGNITEKLPF